MNEYKYFKNKAKIFIVIILCAAILSGAIYVIPNKEERMHIEQSLIDVYELIGSTGQFVSDNGKTDHLSDSEIMKLTENYNDRVDRYMSDEFTAKSNYKWLNENMLSETYKRTVDYTVRSGIVDHDTAYTFYYPGRDHVRTSAKLIGCSVWIEYDENSKTYNIRYSCDKMNVKADLKIEDGVWKLTDLKGQQGEGETTDDENIIKDAENKLKIGKLSEDKKKRLKDIHDIQEICEKKYYSFSEAYKAASDIEIEKLNEYKLK